MLYCLSCMFTAYCFGSAISWFSNLNWWSSSLGLFSHVPLKRDQGDWDWRLRLTNTPNAIGCTSMAYHVYTSVCMCSIKMAYYVYTNVCICIYMYIHICESIQPLSSIYTCMYINSLRNCLASKFDHSHTTLAPYCMASHVYILIWSILYTHHYGFQGCKTNRWRIALPAHCSESAVSYQTHCLTHCLSLQWVIRLKSHQWVKASLPTYWQGNSSTIWYVNIIGHVDIHTW